MMRIGALYEHAEEWMTDLNKRVSKESWLSLFSYLREV